MFAKAFYILIIVVFPLFVNGQFEPTRNNNVVFTGTIIDYETGNPIPNFGIYLMGRYRAQLKDTLFHATETDLSGKFRIQNVPNAGTYILFEEPGYMSRKDYSYAGQFQEDVHREKRFQSIKNATINIDSLGPFLLNMNVIQAIKLSHFNEQNMSMGGISSFAMGTDGCKESWTTTSVASTIPDGIEVTFILEDSDKIKYVDKTVKCIQIVDTNTGVMRTLGKCRD